MSFDKKICKIYHKYMSKEKFTIEDLARLTVENHNEIKDEMGQIRNRLDRVESRLINIGTGQEDIKLRLDNVAYRFELKELDKRVTVLEKKA